MEYRSVAPTPGHPGPDAQLATAAVLRQFEAAHPEVAVLHSLRMPDDPHEPGFDHVVVAGRRLWPICSELWAPGAYWAVGGRRYPSRYFRGLRPVLRPVDPVVFWPARALRRHFGRFAHVEAPLVVAWPCSEEGALRVVLWRPGWAHAMAGPQFARRIGRIIEPAPADVAVTVELLRLQG